MVARGKALTSKAEQLMDLLGEVINHTSFRDTKRLKELLLEEKSEWDMTAFSRGHNLTMGRLASYFSKTAQFSEQTGMTFYYF